MELFDFTDIDPFSDGGLLLMFGARRFYHSSVRKLVIAFGSLFNDVRIARFNSDGSIKETIRLPISYGP